MAGIPRPRDDLEAPAIFVVDGDAPADAQPSIDAFVAEAQLDPQSIRGALFMGDLLMSPNQAAEEAAPHLPPAGFIGPLTSRAWALSTVLKLFESRADIWAEYDAETTRAIAGQTNPHHPTTGRSWRLVQYIDRLITYQEQTKAAAPSSPAERLKPAA